MVDVYYDKDADLSVISDKTIGMVGYGSARATPTP